MNTKANIPFDFNKAAAYFSGEKKEVLPELLHDKEAFNDCQKTWNILNEMKEIEEFDSKSAWKNLQNRFNDEQLLLHQPKNRLNLPILIGIAASIVILLVAGAVLLQYKQSPLEIATNDNSFSKELTLTDGSKVWLNKGASLSYPESFNSNLREVTLSGEAFFNIAPNPDQPFIIQVNQAQVKVLGTSFNIKSDNQNNVEVIVKTGKVEFCDCQATGKNIILTPGEAGTLSNGELKKTDKINTNYLSWLNKKLIFKANLMCNVIEDINLAYHTQVSIQDSAIYSMQITATFDNLSLEELLKSISLTLPITINQQGKNYILALQH